jgi:hypothetical protein
VTRQQIFVVAGVGLLVMLAGMATAAGVPGGQNITPAGTDQVVLYRDSSCTGDHLTITAPNNTADISTLGDWDNQVSCIVLFCRKGGGGVRLTGYQKTNYGGKSNTWSCGSAGGAWSFAGDWWDDTISSFKAKK